MKLIILTIWMNIFISGAEDTGQNNYMLTADHGKYSMSYSNMDKLPYEEGEWFIGRVKMECEEGFTYDEDSISGPIPRIAYHCNVDFIQTEKGVFRSLKVRKQQ